MWVGNKIFLTVHNLKSINEQQTKQPSYNIEMSLHLKRVGFNKIFFVESLLTSCVKFNISQQPRGV